MSNSRNEKTYAVTWLIRRLFRSMAERADHYLADSGLTAANRAVMEFLYPDAALSVPAIASKYRVSRQHVQVVVNELLKVGLLLSEPNPDHKRSRLLRLSDLGRDSFAEIRRNETEILNSLFEGISLEDISTTQQTLATLAGNINKELS